MSSFKKTVLIAVSTILVYVFIYIWLNFVLSFLISSPENFNQNLIYLFILPYKYIKSDLEYVILFLVFFGSVNYFLLNKFGAKTVSKIYILMMLSLSIPFILFSFLGNL
jgi:hypothetical protein